MRNFIFVHCFQVVPLHTQSLLGLRLKKTQCKEIEKRCPVAAVQPGLLGNDALYLELRQQTGEKIIASSMGARHYPAVVPQNLSPSHNYRRYVRPVVFPLPRFFHRYRGITVIPMPCSLRSYTLCSKKVTPKFKSL